MMVVMVPAVVVTVLGTCSGGRGKPCSRRTIRTRGASRRGLVHGLWCMQSRCICGRGGPDERFGWGQGLPRRGWSPRFRRHQIVACLSNSTSPRGRRFVIRSRSTTLAGHPGIRIVFVILRNRHGRRDYRHMPPRSRWFLQRRHALLGRVPRGVQRRTQGLGARKNQKEKQNPSTCLFGQAPKQRAYGPACLRSSSA